MAAYMVNPKYAADLAMIHLYADRMSNLMHDRLGSADKDVAESLINKQFDMFKALNGYKRPRQKRMFY
jgi:hypothetical protein